MTAASEPKRSIRLVRAPDADGVGVFCVNDRGKATYYTFHEIRCDIGGRGFAVHRIGLGKLYHVRIGAPEDCSCDCAGFTYKSRCKHVLGLLALERHHLI